MSPRFLLAAALALGALFPGAGLRAQSSASGTQDDDGEHPTFFEAAVFFLSGKEDVSIQNATNGEGNLLPGALIANVFTLSEGSVQFSYNEDHPCRIVRIRRLEQVAFNFDKFPGPTLARWDWLQFVLPEGAIVTTKRRYLGRCDNTTPTCQTEIAPGSTMVTGDGTQYEIMSTGSVVRRLAAFRYIRASFCPGLPDPPAHVKPY